MIKQILHDYGAASGQRVNFHKSSIFFNRNVDLGHYLRLPSMIGRSKKKAFEFLKDIFLSRLNNWNHRILSPIGKEVLLKTVVQSLPNYAMNVMLLPLGV